MSSPTGGDPFYTATYAGSSTVGPTGAVSDKGLFNRNPAPFTQGGTAGHERTATAKSAHQMLIAAGIMIVLVYLLVIVAGMSQGAGRAVLALFGLAIIILGLGNTGAVINFVNSKPLTPKAG